MSAVVGLPQRPLLNQAGSTAILPCLWLFRGIAALTRQGAHQLYCHPSIDWFRRAFVESVNMNNQWARPGLATVLVAILLTRLPQLSTKDREEIIAWLADHGQRIKPSTSWEIENTYFAGDNRFILVFQVKEAQHVSVINSFSAIDRAKYVATLCPKNNDMLNKLSTFKATIQITLKKGDTKLTAATC